MFYINKRMMSDMMRRRKKAIMIIYMIAFMLISMSINSFAYDENTKSEVNVTQGIPVSYYREIYVTYDDLDDIPDLYYYSEYVNGTFADGFLSLYSIYAVNGHYRATFKGYIVGSL